MDSEMNLWDNKYKKNNSIVPISFSKPFKNTS